MLQPKNQPQSRFETVEPLDRRLPQNVQQFVHEQRDKLMSHRLLRYEQIYFLVPYTIADREIVNPHIEITIQIRALYPHCTARKD